MNAVRIPNITNSEESDLSDEDGTNEMILCQDSDNELSNISPLGAPNLSMSRNVVVKLADSIPKHQHYKLFFNNLFTSIPLMIYLTKEGILPLGTVRLNRVPGVVMSAEKQIKKRHRGHRVEKIANIDNVDVSVVSWFDNKIVSTISTYAGSEPKREKRRFFKQESIHKMIPCPNSVLIYNNYMGGVDLLDSMLGFYPMKLAIADALCKAGKSTKQNRVGRPSSSSIQQMYENKRKKVHTKEIPQEDIRKDVFDHFPYWDESTRSRCKFPGCTGKTYIVCTKCTIPLCINEERNCYFAISYCIVYTVASK
ncbi:uncharacterized protein [Diabrotica undecimpunctata]|uniref:uncharacterized protein n=1 Tax=Diabrotica undecimpunctata TaxID=50387 RepID=UPI003B640F5F